VFESRISKLFEEIFPDSRAEQLRFSLSSFAICPVGPMPVAAQQWIYQAAYEQARASMQEAAMKPVISFSLN